jgi:hypothetical protein
MALGTVELCMCEHPIAPVSDFADDLQVCFEV